MFKKDQRVHFIGMGGSGLSSLVHLALARGAVVSGSDPFAAPILDIFRQKGACFFTDQKAENLDEEVEMVIYTEAIDRESNEEYLEAKARDVEVMSYFEALGELSKTMKTVVVVGTHGKTTTTAMLGTALVHAGLEPTVIVGSTVPAFGGRNIYIGSEEWFVVEGCEYRRSFMSLQPFGLVLLNLEAEHLDYFKDEADYVQAFSDLAAKMPTDGFVVVNARDENAMKVANACAGRVIEVSEGAGFDLGVPGEFNQLNAAQAYAAGLEMGVEAGALRAGLESFKGSGRRLEVKGERDGVMVMDDYGHHPTEIKVTLGALREKYPERRIICVFQPHQYNRTRHMIDEFKSAFGDADQVIIPNIYEARDSAEDKAAVSAKSLVAAIAQEKPQAIWGRDFDTTARLLRASTKKGDLVITMGAGDGYLVGEELLR